MNGRRAEQAHSGRRGRRFKSCHPDQIRPFPSTTYTTRRNRQPRNRPPEARRKCGSSVVFPLPLKTNWPHTAANDRPSCVHSAVASPRPKRCSQISMWLAREREPARCHSRPKCRSTSSPVRYRSRPVRRTCSRTSNARRRSPSPGERARRAGFACPAMRVRVKTLDTFSAGNAPGVQPPANKGLVTCCKLLSARARAICRSRRIPRRSPSEPLPIGVRCNVRPKVLEHGYPGSCPCSS